MTNLSSDTNLWLSVLLDSNRAVQGVLRGFDAFMNVTLENAAHIVKEERRNIGSVVGLDSICVPRAAD